MKSFVLAAILILLAGIVAFVLWFSSARTPIQPAGADGATATSAAQSPQPVVAAPASQDLAAPAAIDGARVASETTDATIADGPLLDVRVAPPAGCADDPEVEVFVLRDKTTLDELMLFLQPKTPASSAKSTVVGRAHADAQGRYLVRVPKSVTKVDVIAAGRSWYVQESEEVDMSHGDKTLALQAECGAWIEGVVTVPDGHAASEVEGLEVSLSSSVQGMRGPLSSVAGMRRHANVQNAAFELRALPAPGSYDLRSSPETLAQADAEARDLVAGKGRKVTLAYLRGGTLKGHVVGPDRKPVEGADVEAQHKGQWFGFDDRAVRSAKSKADGTFELKAVAGPHVELDVKQVGLLMGKKTGVDLADGATVEGLELMLDSGSLISGSLHWPDGKPAPSVDVDVTFDRTNMVGMAAFNALRGASSKGKTNDQGEFKVSGLGVGPFVVTAEALTAEDALALKDASKMERKARMSQARAENVKPDGKPLDLVLKPLSGLRGRVVDADQKPVTKFTLIAQTVGKGPLANVGQEDERRPMEDERGAFLVTGLREGAWKVRVQADGFSLSEPVDVVLPQLADAPELVVTIQRAGMIRGVVLDPNGVPVPGADVQVADGQPNWMRMLSNLERPSGKSDETGHFEVGGLRPGKNALVADSKQFAKSLDVAFDLTPGQVVEGAVLTLRKGGVITGEVFDDGKAAEGMMVQVTELKAFDQQMVFTDGRGRFEVDHVEAGSWQVVAMPARGEALMGDGDKPDPMAAMAKMKMAAVTVVDGEEAHVVLGAPPEDPVSVHGRVTLAEAPAKGAVLMFMPEGKSGLGGMKNTRVGDDGSYAIMLDKPGHYSVSVQRMSSAMNAQSVNEFTAEVPKDKEYRYDLALPEGRISGRVKDSDGNALPNARVTISRDGAGKPGTMWGGQFHELRTDADGGYDALGLDAGTYVVMAGGAELGGMLGNNSNALGGRESRGGLHMSKGEWLRDVDFRLKKAGTVEITIVDDASQPVSGATVFARDDQGREVERFSFVQSDGSGVAHYSGLAPGRYSFSARHEKQTSGDSAPVTLDEAGKSAVRLQLSVGTTLIVKTVDSDGKPVVASIEVLDDNNHDVATMFDMVELSKRFVDGTLSQTEPSFGPLPAGKYKVRATLADGRTQSKPVTLSGQSERRITVEFGK